MPGERLFEFLVGHKRWLCELRDGGQWGVQAQFWRRRISLQPAVSELLDVDGVLAFAEHVLTNGARLWMELGLDQKQRLQQVLFPEGLRFDGEKFGTAVTCLAFKQMPPDESGNSGMASPTGTVTPWYGLSPGIPGRLIAALVLRRAPNGNRAVVDNSARRHHRRVGGDLTL